MLVRRGLEILQQYITQWLMINMENIYRKSEVLLSRTVVWEMLFMLKTTIFIAVGIKGH